MHAHEAKQHAMMASAAQVHALLGTAADELHVGTPRGALAGARRLVLSLLVFKRNIQQ